MKKKGSQLRIGFRFEKLGPEEIKKKFVNILNVWKLNRVWV